MDLTGTGGLVGEGRWHTEGHRVVYLADSASTALLETIVHLEVDENTYPDPGKLLEVEFPPESKIISLAVPEEGDWREDLKLTQKIGDDWLESGASLLAEVPSALVLTARNYLFNPLHPDAAKARIASQRLQRFDPRLFRFRPR